MSRESDLIAEIIGDLEVADSPKLQAQIKKKIGNVAKIILYSYTWNFLNEEWTIPVVASTARYNLPDDFDYPIPNSAGHSQGSVEIITSDKLSYLYPGLANLTAGPPKYLIFRGKTRVEVRPNAEALNITFTYQRVGSIEDLNEGFDELIKIKSLEQMLKVNPSSPNPLMLEAKSEYNRMFYSGLALKAQKLAASFGKVQIQGVPDSLTRNILQIARSYA